jgi:flap endonuclease-1
MGTAIGDLLPRSKIELEQIDTVAIDAFNAIYQFLSIIRQRDGTPLMDNAGRITSHLSGLFYRTAHILEVGVKPAYVFDGEPPELKKNTVTKRRQTREHAAQEWLQARAEGRADAFKYAQASARLDDQVLESSRTLIHYLGVPVVNAPSEGEAQAAHMASTGDVSFAASQDIDALLFGAPRLVRNLTITGRRKLPGKNVYVNISPEVFSLRDILASLEITREQLIEVSILVGTDYNEGVKGIGPKKALRMIKTFGIQQALESLGATTDFEHIKQIFLSPSITETYKLTWAPVHEKEIIEFLCDEHNFSRERVENTLDRIIAAQNDTNQKSLAQWL